VEEEGGQGWWKIRKWVRSRGGWSDEKGEGFIRRGKMEREEELQKGSEAEQIVYFWGPRVE